MCLLKVYLKNGNNKTLIAEDIALVIKEENGIIKLRSLDFMDIATLEEVDMSLIDTINSVMILKPKT